MALRSLCRCFIALACLNFTSLGSAKNVGEANFFWDKFEVQSVRIPSLDGVELASILFTPKEADFPGQRPTIIFINSWSLSEHEYIAQARKFAEQGYLVLSYATRGFSTSGGTVSVGGPNDIADVSRVIDWMEANTRIDTARLGLAGVSYGAGIALLAVAQDARIQSVAALSGWGNLEQALYGNDTIREVWLNLLLVTGSVLGRLDQDIWLQVNRLRNNTEIESVRRWAKERSPLTFIDKINARRVPIMVANSYQDGLFPPSQMRAFYEQLEGPKAFYLDNGIHASSAMPGLLGLPSQVWSEVHQWFNIWLQDGDSNRRRQNPISFESGRDREYYAQFPTARNKQDGLLLKPVNRLTEGNADIEVRDTNSVIRFQGGVDSAATTGIPLISDTANATIGLPSVVQLPLIDRRFAALYSTENISNTLRLRGSPAINLWIGPHEGPLQLVAYLYDRNSLGFGTLIAHGVYSQRTSQIQETEAKFDLNITAYDVAEGHRLVLVIDTKDPLYSDLTFGKYQVELLHEGAKVTSLALPLVP